MKNNINEDDILLFEKENFYVFPDVYKKFLLEYNGYSINAGILLYSLEELKETNEYIQIQEYQPAYFAIGDDGGGLVFLMKQSIETTEVIIVDMSDYDITNCFDQKSDFIKWFEEGCSVTKDNESDEDLHSNQGSVILTSQPQSGLKDLVQIKNIFNIQISTSELFKMTKNLPCILVENITYAKAQKLIDSNFVSDKLTTQKYPRGR